MRAAPRLIGYSLGGTHERHLLNGTSSVTTSAALPGGALIAAPLAKAGRPANRIFQLTIRTGRTATLICTFLTLRGG